MRGTILSTREKSHRARAIQAFCLRLRARQPFARPMTSQLKARQLTLDTHDLTSPQLASATRHAPTTAAPFGPAKTRRYKNTEAENTNVTPIPLHFFFGPRLLVSVTLGGPRVYLSSTRTRPTFFLLLGVARAKPGSTTDDLELERRVHSHSPTPWVKEVYQVASHRYPLFGTYSYAFSCRRMCFLCR